MGLPISWAMPAASRPTEESFSERMSPSGVRRSSRLDACSDWMESACRAIVFATTCSGSTYTAGWTKSSHRAVAACNDCHAPHDNIVHKYLVKGENGFWHSLNFTTGRHPDPLRIREKNRRVQFVVLERRK